MEVAKSAACFRCIDREVYRIHTGSLQRPSFACGLLHGRLISRVGMTPKLRLRSVG